MQLAHRLELHFVELNRLVEVAKMEHKETDHFTIMLKTLKDTKAWQLTA